MAEQSQELVTVLETGEISLVAVAEALLRADGIEYVVTNRAIQDVLPTEGFSLDLMRVQVCPGDEEAARVTLANIEEHPDISEDDTEYDDDDEQQ